MQLQQLTISIARSFVGVREEPSGSNTGKDVTTFLKSAGIDSPAPWCAAFVYCCIERAAQQSSLVNPFAKMNGKAWTPSWLAYADKYNETLTGRRAKSLAESGHALLAEDFSSDAESARIQSAKSGDDTNAQPILWPGMFFLLYYPKLKRVGHIGFIASSLDALLLLKHGGDRLAICDRGYTKKHDRLLFSKEKNDGQGDISLQSSSESSRLTTDCKRAVNELISRGLVATIEGNTDLKGSRTGGSVCLRTRKLAGLHRIAGYG